MNVRTSIFPSNQSMNVAMLMLPGVAIAATSIGSIGAVYGFLYGVTMAFIGLHLAQNGKLSPKNLTHLFGITLLVPGVALAATTGGEFQAFYDFIYDAATG